MHQRFKHTGDGTQRLWPRVPNCILTGLIVRGAGCETGLTVATCWITRHPIPEILETSSTFLILFENGVRYVKVCLGPHGGVLRPSEHVLHDCVGHANLHRLCHRIG